MARPSQADRNSDARGRAGHSGCAGPPRRRAPRALRDIRAGRAAGRFTVTDAEIALGAVAGGLLGLLRLRERHPERVDEASVDQLAEACLRLLGVPASEAARLVASSLSPVGAVSRYRNHSPSQIQAGILTTKIGKIHVVTREPGYSTK